MLTLVSLGFGLLLVLAVVYTLRRMFSRSLWRGAAVVIAITFCMLMGVAFLAPPRIADLMSALHAILRKVPPVPGVPGMELVLVLVVGLGLTILLIVGLRRLLRPVLQVNWLVLLVGIVIIVAVAAIPASRTGAVARDTMEATAMVLVSFLAVGSLMLTHHVLGPIFSVMSLGIAVSGLLNEKVIGLDHRAVFDLLDLAGLKGELLHFLLLGVSVVWGLHDIILRPHEAVNFGDS
jgi:hypothetical protein